MPTDSIGNLITLMQVSTL